MEINKEFINYISGIISEIKKVEEELKVTPISRVRKYALKKSGYMLKEKLKYHLNKMNRKINSDINVVHYKSTHQGRTRYFQQILPLSEEEIKVYFEVGNIVTPVQVEIINIMPIDNRLKEVEVNETEKEKEGNIK